MESKQDLFKSFEIKKEPMHPDSIVNQQSELNVLRSVKSDGNDTKFKLMNEIKIKRENKDGTFDPWTLGPFGLRMLEKGNCSIIKDEKDLDSKEKMIQSSTVRPKKVIQCPVCGMGQEGSKNHLIRHIATTHQRTLEEQKCFICNKDFKSKHPLEKTLHIVEHKLTEEYKNLTLPVLPKGTGNSSGFQLRDGQYVLSATNKSSETSKKSRGSTTDIQENHSNSLIKCPLCPFKLEASKILLHSHLELFHNKEIEKNKCCICDEKVIDKSMIKHIAEHTEGLEEKIQAKRESKKVDQIKNNSISENPKNSSDHLIEKNLLFNTPKSSYKQKPAKRSIGNRKQASNLANMNTRFLIANTKPYESKNKNIAEGKFVCSICNAKLMSAEYLSRHVDYIHLNNPAPVSCDPKPKMTKQSNTNIAFAQLPEATVTNTATVNNQQTKQTLLKHKCEICNIVFARKKSLNRHIKIGHKPWLLKEKRQCYICYQYFSCASFLSKHIQLDHPGVPVKKNTKKKKKNDPKHVSLPAPWAQNRTIGRTYPFDPSV